MGCLKYVCGFSGGADSQACALWMRHHLPPEDILLLNSQAGRNEHPLTVEFVANYSRTIFPVVEVVPLIKDLGGIGTQEGKTRDRRREFDDKDELTFRGLAYIKGRFPSRKAQFCTEFTKLAPQLRWLTENLTDHGVAYERYVGVRRDESKERANTPDRKWDDYFDTFINYPLASWSKAQVFEYLADHGEEPNPLYKMGFSRVGCAPCVNAGKDDIRLWACRAPEMIDKVRSWEKQNGRTFFGPMVPGRDINWIDEVVEWSKTARGGQQGLLGFVEAEAESGNCVSKYGLCE